MNFGRVITKFPKLLILIREIATLRRLIYHRIYINPELERSIVDQFCKLYVECPISGKTWANTNVVQNTFWLGILTRKCPLDLWIYQEIIFELEPDIIIECERYMGGVLCFWLLCAI